MRSFIKSGSLIIALICLVSCADPALESMWRNKEIVIDGNKNEWQGDLKYFEDEKVAIGITNDDEFVYFCLATSDEKKIAQIMRKGLIVWLDPLSSDGETIGIQYPLKAGGERNGEKGLMKGHPESDNGDHISKMIERLKIEQNEVQIVNENKNPINSFPIKSMTGLDLRMDYAMSQLVYELRVPLADNNKGNVFTDVLPNEIVKVGFESGQNEKAEKKERGSMEQDGGSPSGGRQGGGRSGGGPGGQRGGGNMGGMTESQTNIEFWMEVKLAKDK